MASVCEAVRTGQVTEAENSLHQCCDELENRIAALEERLTSILGSDELGKSSTSEPPEEQLVPLADSIRLARKSVVRSTVRINSIIRRIEL